MRRRTGFFGMWETRIRHLAAVLLTALAASVTLARGGAATDAPAALLAGMGAAEVDDWAAVRAAREKLPPPLRDYLLWRELLGSDEALSFEAFARFVETHADWPESARLRRLAESRLDAYVAADRVVAFFDRFPPLTPRGALHLAVVQLARGEADRARRAFERAYPEAVLSARDIEDLERSFGRWMTPALDATRVGRLLWAGRWREARDMLGRLDRATRRLAFARLQLQRAEPGVDAAIAAVPSRLRDDPGLAFDRLVWRLRKGLERDADQILLHPPAPLVEPARWWRLRENRIREALERGDRGRAHALARAHAQSEGRTFAEAEWMAGWVALRFAGQPAEALDRFRRLFDQVSTPVSRARAAYWAGRAATELGRHAEAQKWYARAASFPTTFYGQLAADATGRPLDLDPDATDAIPAAAGGDLDPMDPRLLVATTLCPLPRDRHAAHFFDVLAREVGTAGARSLLARARSCGRADIHVRLAKILTARGIVPRLQAFPLIDVELADGVAEVDPALLLALARQESEFAHDARSHAGARGMTQILPSTARVVAERVGIPFSMQRLTEDPGYQMRLAAAHLARLMRTFDRDPLLVLAAYNAGEGRVREWLRRFGDPRRMDPAARIDWIELLPFAETRNYVQRVLEGWRVYRHLREHASTAHPLLTTGGRPLPYPAPVRRPTGGTT